MVLTRERSYSTNSIVDEVDASSKLSKVLQENKVYLGGSAVGKGFHRAARHFLNSKAVGSRRPEYFENEEAKDLNPDILNNPVEESFYVVDLGLVVSQFYQWRKAFPRVEPFYAVKCNPDPVIVRTLAILGANFDCASRAEIRLVKQVSQDLSRQPEIIYANPCKARSHMIEAVCKGVNLVTFDNAMEVAKCAAVSKKIKLVMRIVTDDKGSVCRLSSKFGAHRHMWRTNLAAAKKHGLEVVGVSFHVGSGCRDASRYELALRDAKEIFTFAKEEFGFDMNIVDIGGGFPGETHSIWNPADLDSSVEDDEEEDDDEEKDDITARSDEHLMFFSDIAEKVRPMLDELFPEESGVRLIAEPGRYFVAASGTLVASVVSCRNNLIDENAALQPVDNNEASMTFDQMTREDELQVVHKRGVSFRGSMDQVDSTDLFEAINEEMAEYSKIFAKQSFAQQEADVYNDALDLAQEGFDTAVDLLGPPEDDQLDKKFLSVEGMNAALVSEACADGEGDDGVNIMACAGEAAVQGVVMHCVAETSTFQDDFAYYINDGVYGAFNNIMFDHAIIRPRQLKNPFCKKDANHAPEPGSESNNNISNTLYASTVFGPTCDSIDVIARSALLPRLEVGDWLYFQNMGAYTNAAASSFNGFSPSERFYVCSVLPEYFEPLIAGPEVVECEHEEISDEEESEPNEPL